MIRPFGYDELYFLVTSARWTLALSMIALIAGGCVGFILAVLRVVGGPRVRTLVVLYIELIQAMPVLMLLFLGYFGLSFAGLEFPPLAAAGVAMSLYTSAYLADIWRGCIQAIGREQWQASEALALTTFQQLRYVILPQAVRIALGPTVNFSVQLVKNTSVAALIGFVELTRAGQLLNNITFRPLTVFGVVAVVYFCICYPLSLFGQGLEGRYNARRAR